MQIDLLRIENNTAVCNLYTDDRCIKIIMAKDDAELLRKDGFFTRKTHQVDSAGAINTTAEYHKVRYAKPGTGS